MWICQVCQARIDGGFEVCWRCGTSVAGDQDPFFLQEVNDVSRAEWFHNADEKPKQARDPDLADSSETSVDAPYDLVECYWATNSNEAMFLANQMRFDGIEARADFVDLRIVLAGLFGLIPAGPYFAPRVWTSTRDLVRARDWLADYEERRRRRAIRRVSR